MNQQRTCPLYAINTETRWRALRTTSSMPECGDDGSVKKENAKMEMAISIVFGHHDS